MPKAYSTQVAASTPFDPTGTAYDSDVLNVQDALELTQTLADAGRYALVLQHNGSVSDGTFIGYDSLIPGDASPIIFPEPCTIFEFTFTNNRATADYTLEFRKNSTVATPFYSVSKVNTQFFADTIIEEDFAAGDQIYIKYVDDGTNAQDVVMVLFMQNTGA